MRSRRYSSIHLGLALGAALAAVGPFACSSGGPQAAPEETPEVVGPTGTMAMALTARGASGSLYRLRQGVFEVFRTGDGQIGVPTPVPFPPPIGVPNPGIPDIEPPIFSPSDPRTTQPPPTGAGGSSSSGGGSSGGFSGSFSEAGSAGAAGSGIGGSFPTIPPFPDDFFSTTLFTENDPLATTLEATLPIGAFQITLFGGWFLEKIVDGEAQQVEARLVSSAFQDFSIQANDETTVVYRFETNGEIVEFGQGRLIVEIEVDEVEEAGPNARRSVIETNLTALSGLTLRQVFESALANSGADQTGVTAEGAYHAIIDSYAPAATARDPELVHCDDETTGGSPSLNGFPLMCGRLEAEQFDNLDVWQPLAIVNRLDLAPADGANCGQQRMIFANNSFIGNSRMFIIVEAMVPNPSPECGVDACRPIAEFWNSLADIEDAGLRGALLQDVFLRSGLGSFGPFMNSDRLGPNGGQVRTNNFNDFVWTLREFHFQSAPAVLPLPQPVAESPNGELWNDLSTLPQGEECRESFLRAAEGVLGNNLSAMTFPVAQACKDAESPNDFFRQDYVTHLASGSGDFIARLDSIANSAGLSAFDVAARARFAGSCMGCHQEASGSSLGGGLTAPFQGDFVQVSEFSTENCGDGTLCFGLSDALRNTFLPHRLNVQNELLSRPSSCGGGGSVDGGVIDPPSPPRDPGDSPGFPSDIRAPEPDLSGAPRRTLGGQLVVPHGH